MTTDPAEQRTFRSCGKCGSQTRADIARGMDGVSRCFSCGSDLDAQPPSAPASPIIARHVYRSPSLRDPKHPCPLLR